MLLLRICILEWDESMICGDDGMVYDSYDFETNVQLVRDKIVVFRVSFLLTCY